MTAGGIEPKNPTHKSSLCCSKDYHFHEATTELYGHILLKNWCRRENTSLQFSDGSDQRINVTYATSTYMVVTKGIEPIILWRFKPAHYKICYITIYYLKELNVSIIQRHKDNINKNKKTSIWANIFTYLL